MEALGWPAQKKATMASRPSKLYPGTGCSFWVLREERISRGAPLLFMSPGSALLSEHCSWTILRETGTQHITSSWSLGARAGLIQTCSSPVGVCCRVCRMQKTASREPLLLLPTISRQAANGERGVCVCETQCSDISAGGQPLFFWVAFMYLMQCSGHWATVGIPSPTHSQCCHGAS